ncbi:MAG: hypothetical protein JSS04_07155 [Proteobacteria bacterium]|nr:hypothetical protein [Pseudomonadota bacterium]
MNGRSYGVGELELVSLASLRERGAAGRSSGRLRVRNMTGDVRKLHQSPERRAALFQVASQFNLLEMVSPEVRPEDGVTRYQHDRTQGPACAIAAGAATIYRNYFVPVDNRSGQTRDRQLDGLADVGMALSQATGLPVTKLWQMKNGYALCEPEGLDAITDHLAGLNDDGLDILRSLLRIGVHRDVEVTDSDEPTRPLVSQAFCSALPVAYTRIARARWQAFATLVLEAADEATLLAAVLNAKRGASNIVLLTRLGGGAFGNDDSWIDAAMRRALDRVSAFDLDVRVVSFGHPPTGMMALERAFPDGHGANGL